MTAPGWPITVSDSLCGHLRGEPHDGECDYWRGVVLGEYPPPDMPVRLPRVGPHRTDPALDVWRPGPDMVEQMCPPLRWSITDAGVGVGL